MADLRGPAPTGSYDGRLGGPLLAVFLVLCAAAAVPAQPVPGPVAPDFTVAPVPFAATSSSAPITLSAHRGQVVVLDLMAVACVPCREVTRQLKPLWFDHSGGDRLLLLSVDTWADPASGNAWGGENATTLRALQESEGAPWPHALDTDHVWTKYDAVALPRVVVVGPDGRVAYDQPGIPDTDAVRSVVERLLA
jgi:hypothetical protein